MLTVKIAYIGGGSRGWARTLMNDLAQQNDFLAEVALYDINVESAEKNAKIGNDLALREDVIGKHTYTVASTLEAALTGAKFVVLSILPGTFEEMASDVHLPEKYGIYQSVGDSSGPGGILRALRTVPIYAEFARAIEKYCPDAWVINYTNPMTLCTAALYRVFPGIKAFGCCHEVFNTQKLIARAFQEHYGEKISHKDVRIDVTGINHFTWITGAKYKEYDLFELYREFAQKYRNDGYYLDSNKTNKTDYFAYDNKVKFDLFLRFGAIAAAGDRHLAEFCPGKWYLENPEEVDRWGFSLTPVSWRVQNMEERIAKTDRIYNGEEPFKLYRSDEEGVLLMKALLGVIPPFVTNCNLPNRGQAPDLALGAIVETNAVFSSDAVTPVCAQPLPKGAHALVERIVNEQAMLLDAAINSDYALAFECMLADPLVTVTPKQAKQMYLEMLRNTEQYLPKVSEYLDKN